MKGLVYRYNKNVYISLYDENNKITSGFMVHESIYRNLKEDEICFSEVIIKDGTEEMEISDIEQFIEDTVTSSSTNIFYCTNNLNVYKYDKKITEYIKNDEFVNIAKYLINIKR